MSKQNLQDTLNQLSLIMTTSEEIMQAVKLAGIHPKLAEVLIKIHTQQKDLAENITEIRKNQMLMAQVLERSADVSAQSMATTIALAQRHGIDPATLFQGQGKAENEND